MKFCTQCGGTLDLKIPRGDNRKRYTCNRCDHVHYQNPRIITGCLVTWESRVLLCQRAIAPRKGYWTLPAGFLENGETTEDGAVRETWEEANAKVNLRGLYTIFSLPHISQIYMFYRAELVGREYSAGEESLACDLYEEENIPWDNLSFPVIRQTLEHYFQDRRIDAFPVHDKKVLVERR